MSESTRTDVVFIHGAWVGPTCWNSFRTHFDRRGLRSIAPSWPFDDRPVEQLRASPDPALARVGVKEIVDHYEAIIRTLPNKPLLVGHSFGGLFVQMLLDRGLGAGGVAIDSAPPRGVMPTPTAVRAGAGVLFSWLGWRRVLRISPESFAWGFTHNLDAAGQRSAFEEHVIPTPGRPFFQAAFAPLISATKVRFDNADRAPLFMIAGEKDRTVPAAMNRDNVARYQQHARVKDKTDYREFAGRSHWIIAEPGWEEVADAAIDWATQRGIVATQPRGDQPRA
ncbi:MAG: alpha/beta fold hydrolase [Polyangiales bacterium]